MLKNWISSICFCLATISTQAFAELPDFTQLADKHGAEVC